MVAPLVAAGLITGGASLAGGIFRDVSQRKMAREQMDFQERMSSTAYQRAVKDMRSAGINPMLAYQQGGASTPGGAQAQLQDVVSPAVSSAMAGARVRDELRLLRSQRKFHEAKASEALSHGNALAAQAVTTAKHGLLMDSQKILADYQIPGMRNIANMERSRLGRVMPYVDRIMRNLPGLGIILGGGRLGMRGRGSFKRVGGDIWQRR